MTATMVPPGHLVEKPSARLRGVSKATTTAMKSRGVVNQPEDRHRRRDGRPMLLEHDILEVENVDNVAWDFRWDRKHYLIGPHNKGFVPFPALVLKLGDPRSQVDTMTAYNTDDGQRGIVLTRHEEMCRLFAHYGIENENIDELVDFAPKVIVTTMAGDPVSFPAQDPEMTAFPTPDAPEPGKENTDTRRLMDRLAQDNEGLRAELDEMRQLIAERLGGTEAVGPEHVEADLLAASLTGGGATPDTGPQTAIQ